MSDSKEMAGRAEAISNAVDIIQEVVHSENAKDQYGHFYNPTFKVSRNTLSDSEDTYRLRLSFDSFTIRRGEQLDNLRDFLSNYTEKYRVFIKKDKPLSIQLEFEDE